MKILGLGKNFMFRRKFYVLHFLFFTFLRLNFPPKIRNFSESNSLNFPPKNLDMTGGGVVGHVDNRGTSSLGVSEFNQYNLMLGGGASLFRLCF